MTTVTEQKEQRSVDGQKCRVTHNRRYLEALFQASQAVSQSLNLEVVASLALRAGLKVINFEAGVVRFLDESAQELIIVAYHGLPSELLQEMKGKPGLKVGGSLPGQVIRSGQPLLVADITKEASFTSHFLATHRSGFKTGGFFPLKASGRVVGTIGAFSRQQRVFSREDTRMMASLGNMLGTAVDHARLYQAEKNLRLQLEASERERTEFLDTLAHEIKTPLTAMLASSGIMAAKIPDDGGFLCRLSRNLEASALNLSRRVSELTDFARSRRCQLTVAPQAVEISAIIQAVVYQLSPLVENKKQGLLVEQARSLPDVNADTDRTQQVLINLLTNASKFSPTGARLFLRARQEGPYLLLEVEDSAPAIAAGEARRLFTPYYRGAQAKGVPGLGLGLHICKRLVELQGGSIWLKRKAHGNVFCFTLPLSRRG